jgi:DNA-binding transcriptional MocR family regulator
VDTARDTLAAACTARGAILFKGDINHDLALEGPPPSPVCARLGNASWVYHGSFSKSLAPGLGLGYLAGSPEPLPGLVRLKQAADLHSCRLSQQLALAALRDAGCDSRLETLRTRYRARRDGLTLALAAELGPLARRELPPGGLFLWLELAERHCDTGALLAPALA